MLLRKKYNSKPKCYNYTLMLIPGKYGSAKTLHIPRWTIKFIISFNVTALAFIAIFAFNYKSLRDNYNTYLNNNQQLKLINESQENEISELRKSADEIKSKLEQLKDLERQLRDKLNLNSMKQTEAIAAYLGSSTDSSQSIDAQIDSINEALSSADKKIAVINSKPSLLPSRGTITSYFGKRRNPFGGKGYEFHGGVDISSAYGSEVKASGDGVILYSGWQIGYGQVIIINHGYSYTTFYGHNSKLLAKQGERVKKGQAIALMGSTGRSTGTHVHFEIRINNKQVDPLKIINGGV